MDLRFKTEEFDFGMRASVVILDEKKEKVLVHHSLKYKHHALPGGGIEGSETSIEAAKRELEEEIGVEIEIQNCIAVIENFFERDEKAIHEVQFVHLAKFKNPEMYKKVTFKPIEEHKKGKIEFLFIPIDKLEEYYLKPDCMIEIIQKQKFNETTHVINKD